jgi:hypothetical protein
MAEGMTSTLHDVYSPVVTETEFLYACELTDAEVHESIWEAQRLMPLTRLTFAAKPRAPTLQDFGWTCKGKAARTITVAAAERLNYGHGLGPYIFDTGASIAVADQTLVDALGLPVFKRPSFVASMANQSGAVGNTFTVLILALHGTNSDGVEVVQEFGVQALILPHVAGGLLIGDATLARIGAALYVAESTLTLFQGEFQTHATRWVDVETTN